VPEGYSESKGTDADAGVEPFLAEFVYMESDLNVQPKQPNCAADTRADMAVFRKKAKLGTLEPFIVAVLDQHAPGWDADRYALVWRHNFERYRDFVALHGTWPKQESKNDAENILGRWLGSQRTAFRKCELSQDRIKNLEAIDGHSWDPYTEAWDVTLERYRAFLSTIGRSPSEASVQSSEKQLGRWANAQRSAFRKGTLEAPRIDLLESVHGHSWDPQAEGWETTFEQYGVFLSGVARSPNAKSEDSAERGLGVWLKNQRAAHRKNTLEPSRVKRLESIAGHRWHSRTS
jgi:hypothetical protein